jgi:Glucodextranase, domain B
LSFSNWMINRLRRPWLVAPCIALACIAIAGCAAGGPASASGGAAVTLTAPTSGATVGVHQIQVVGTVTPSNAVVRVAGQPATVTEGRFKRVLWLRAATTTIQITAAAAGHPATSITTTVHFSAQLARELVAARTVSVLAASQALASVTSAPRTSGPRVGRRRSSTSATTTGPTPTTPSLTLTPTTTTTTTTSSTSSTNSGSGSSPVAPAPLTPAQIQQRYVQGCSKAARGQSAVPYCTCMYGQLLQAGALASPATIAAVARAIEAYQQTLNIFALPVFLRNAMTDCASQLPTPPLTVTRLPPLNHGPTPPKATAATKPPSR